MVYNLVCCTHCEMITAIKVINIHNLTQLPFSFSLFVVRTFKIYPLRKFQVYKTIVLTIVTTLYILSLEFLQLA